MALTLAQLATARFKATIGVWQVRTPTRQTVGGDGALSAGTAVTGESAPPF